MTTKFILVTYDIHDNKRRSKVANELKNYGVRVQYSVFECLPDEKKEKEMRARVAKLIDDQEDSVRYYVLCEACKEKVSIQGYGEINEDDDFWII